MGKGDRVARKIYMREHSFVFRRSEKRIGKTTSLDFVIEDKVVELEDLSSRIFKIVCRNKQKLLQQG